MSTLYGIKKGHYYGTEFSFRDGTYSSLKSFDINFFNLPVYRADTKEEFVTDMLFFAGTLATAGSTGGLKFVFSKLESD